MWDSESRCTTWTSYFLTMYSLSPNLCSTFLLQRVNWTTLEGKWIRSIQYFKIKIYIFKNYMESTISCISHVSMMKKYILIVGQTLRNLNLENEEFHINWDRGSIIIHYWSWSKVQFEDPKRLAEQTFMSPNCQLPTFIRIGLNMSLIWSLSISRKIMNVFTLSTETKITKRIN